MVAVNRGLLWTMGKSIKVLIIHANLVYVHVCVWHDVPCVTPNTTTCRCMQQTDFAEAMFTTEYSTVSSNMEKIR